jgi:hypothetical protein
MPNSLQHDEASARIQLHLRDTATDKRIRRSLEIETNRLIRRTRISFGEGVSQEVIPCLLRSKAEEIRSYRLAHQIIAFANHGVLLEPQSTIQENQDAIEEFLEECNYLVGDYSLDDKEPTGWWWLREIGEKGWARYRLDTDKDIEVCEIAALAGLSHMADYLELDWLPFRYYLRDVYQTPASSAHEWLMAREGFVDSVWQHQVSAGRVVFAEAG